MEEIKSDIGGRDGIMELNQIEILSVDRKPVMNT